MKKTFTTRRMLYALSLAGLMLAACQKADDATAAQATDTAADVSASSAIAVVASATAANTDSVDVVQDCGRGGRRDSIAVADLPSVIGTYLETNYAGYVFHKAFAVKDGTGTVTGYAVIVYYNDKPVGLRFDSAGAFVNVLEQRERSGRHGRGGHFPHRDSKGQDSVALSALPAAITTYFTANYSSDTLVKAYRNTDSSYVVLSKNGDLFATVFNAGSAFVKRSQLPERGGRPRGHVSSVEQSALPASIATYLAATYPAFTFQKAVAVKEGSTVSGYVVVIDANNTTYAVAFDASGNYLSAKTLY